VPRRDVGSVVVKRAWEYYALAAEQKPLGG